MRNAQTFQRMETPHLWVGTYSLRMETPPLRVGDVPFTDGNAAARTFGRAHRRRPYHFSCGSVSQGCWRIVRRRTNTRKVCWRTVRRWTKSRKGCWRGDRRRTKTKKGCRRTVCRRTKSRKGCRRTVCRWTKTRKGCRRTVRRRTKTREVAWQRGLMEVGRGGACVPARVAP